MNGSFIRGEICGIDRTSHPFDIINKRLGDKGLNIDDSFIAI